MKVIGGQITKNFNVKEFACKGEMLLNESVFWHIQRLQRFRDWYNRPMPINSGYRSAAHNKAVGGASNSQHLYGLAADIALPAQYYGFTPQRKAEFRRNVESKWEKLCKADGIQGGAGWYGTFFHLDSRAGKGNMARWDG